MYSFRCLATGEASALLPACRGRAPRARLLPHGPACSRARGCGAPPGTCHTLLPRPAPAPRAVRCLAVAPPRPPPSIWSDNTLGSSCEDVMQALHATEQLRSSLGAPLSADEQRSLVKCLDSAHLGVDTCLVDGLPALYEYTMAYCEAVSTTQADDLELVEGALLLVEQLALAMGMEAPGAGGPAAAALPFSGEWQILVTTGGGWPYGRLQYVPIFELLDLDEVGRRFRLESKAGPLYTIASGDVTWLQPNQFQYQVTELRVELLGGSLRLPAPAPEAEPATTMHVFAATPSMALARSSLGGISLLGRPV